MLPPGVEAVERTQRGVTHRHVLPPFPPGGVARHRLVQNVRSRSNSETASLHPELPRPLPSHAGSIVHCRLDLIFMAMGAPQAHAKLGSNRPCPISRPYRTSTNASQAQSKNCEHWNPVW